MAPRDPQAVNAWNLRYSNEEYLYGKEPNDFLRNHAARIKPRGRVLCLAEGEGRNAVYLAKQGFRVIAVDQSDVGMKKLETWARAEGLQIETHVADLSDFHCEPYSFDAVISVWCHLPPDLRRRVHKGAVQSLGVNGVFILEAYHPRQLNYRTGGPPVAELMMTKKDLEGELAGLRFEISEEIDREIHEGAGHSGLSAVTRILGLRTD